MSGPYADINGQGSVHAVQMAIEDFGGEVLGKKIELVYADHQNKADIGANAARQWFDQEQVDVVVNLANSSVALAVQGPAAEKGKITLNTSAASSALTGNPCTPTVFSWTYPTTETAAAPGTTPLSHTH